VEYGGRGSTLIEQAIYNEETARAQVPSPANFQGINNAGPAIIHHGTRWQKERYLPLILSADEIWCQGFSEPEAGSDLASLKTRGVKAEGGWRLNGQKIWTSTAHHAQMCIVLARTDADAPKHRGITYFLMHVDQPGVQLRRIKQADGGNEFNEMFLDDAWVSDEDLLGSANGGWSVAITTLMHERIGVGVTSSVRLRQQLDTLISSCRRTGADRSLYVRERLAQLHAEVEATRLNVMRGLSAQLRSGSAGPEGSLTKWQFSEVGRDIAALGAEVMGTEALELESVWGHAVIRSLAFSIEGGTTEIQKNIIAERVLGLPRGPR
jgi:alkylation response protein AidB-like acyl-CoA dehydrogenase